MKITGIHVCPGRNIYSHYPVMKVKVDLQQLEGIESSGLPGFQRKLLTLLPGLQEHHCSRGRRGGFVERLQEGTMLGHILEHILLELQALIGAASNYGRTTRLKGGGVEIVFEYQEEHSARYLVEEGVKLLTGLVAGRQTTGLQKILHRAKDLKDRHSPGPSTGAIIEAARKRGIPCFFLKEEASLLQLGTGKYLKRVQATLTDETSCLAADLVSDKSLTKELLAKAGIPVPPGKIVNTGKEAVLAGEQLGYPLAIKPLRGNHGNGVTLGIMARGEALKAFSLAKHHCSRVLVEKYIAGRQYRLVVVKGEMVAASERKPPFVLGDGTSTLQELVDKENENPLRGRGHDKPLTRIEIDDAVKLVLRRKKLTMQGVPFAGQVIYLRDNANLSTGGVAEDVTEEVHPEIARMCCTAVSLAGLDVAGVDLVTHHISSPLSEGTGAIIEVNAAPGIRMHHHPQKGKPRDVAGKIVEGLFPAGQPSRVPLFSITGTNGKTTTTRLIAHILSQEGKTVGAATTDGIFRGGELIMPGDTTGPESARTLLMDREVEALVLETARGGILRRGLGYDLADCAVITNVNRDHLGQDGLEDMRDLVCVKSLVAEAVARDGAVILNAADPSTTRITSLTGADTVLFGAAKSPSLQKHLKAGGRGVFFSQNSLYWTDGSRITPLLPVHKIPLTFQGKAYHHIENAMAAAAACLSQGVPLGLVRKGLRSFLPDLGHNPGRGNLFNVNGRHVLVDYGHNPKAFEAAARLARQQSEGCMLGVIGVPGDRSDALIIKAGEKAARYFHRLYIKEDSDLRGREPGETAKLLLKGCLKAKKLASSPEIVLQEEAAFRKALEAAAAGDIVVVFYEKLAPVLEVIREIMADLPNEKSQAHGQSQVN